MSIENDFEKLIAIKGNKSDNKKAFEKYNSRRRLFDYSDAIEIYSNTEVLSYVSKLGHFKVQSDEEFDDCSFIVATKDKGNRAIREMLDKGEIVPLALKFSISQRDEIEYDGIDENEEIELVHMWGDKVVDYLTENDKNSPVYEKSSITDNDLRYKTLRSTIIPSIMSNIVSKRTINDKLSPPFAIDNPNVDVSSYLPTEDIIRRIEEEIPDNDVLDRMTQADGNQIIDKITNIISDSNEESSYKGIIENVFYEKSMYSALWSMSLINHFNVLHSGLYDFIYAEDGKYNSQRLFPCNSSIESQENSPLIILAENVKFEPALRKSTSTTLVVTVNTLMGSEESDMGIVTDNALAVGYFRAHRFDIDHTDSSITPSTEGEYIMFDDPNLYSYLSHGGSATVMSIGSIMPAGINKEDMASGNESILEDALERNEIVLSDITVFKNGYDSPVGYSIAEIRDKIDAFSQQLRISIQAPKEGEEPNIAKNSIDKESIYKASFNDYTYGVDSSVSQEFISLKAKEIVSKCSQG